MKPPAVHVVRSGNDWLVLVDHRLQSKHKSQAAAVSCATRIERTRESGDVPDDKAIKS